MSCSTDAVVWHAQWISRNDPPLTNWRHEVLPAPLLRCAFELPQPTVSGRIAVCGLGYYELRFDGQKVGDHVLSPTVSQYDRRAFYQTYELAALDAGPHVIGAMLGNGWYNCSTTETWHFDKASWRDRPKLLLQLELTLADGGTRRIVTGPDWRAGQGAIRFDALRNGEYFDANHDVPGWDRPGFDDSAWSDTVVVAGPGGVLEPMAGPPCKVVDTITPVACWRLPDSDAAVYDMGQGFAGWAQLQMPMTAGQMVELSYADQLTPQRDIDMAVPQRFIFEGQAQTDRYTAASDGVQQWEPRFTYHGFRYVRVTGLQHQPQRDDVRGRVINTAMADAGSFACSNDPLNRLQAATRWSYLSNFVSIPTDCPHREKNGWTGDAQLAIETGLMNFDAADAYLPWLITLADAQRPNGQLPGIAPTAGWGYNWGSGPAWDAALTVIPWMIYVYTGKTAAIERLYPAMQRYAAFCDAMMIDHIAHFGLGDWCAPKGVTMTPAELTSTAYCFHMFDIVSRCAAVLGHDDEAQAFTRRAQQVRRAFQRAFYHGDGLYAQGEMTALAAAVYFGLAESADVPRVVQRLAETVEAADATAQFGILGAKFIPRVLADHGRPDLALRLFTQPKEPGWVRWIEQGATTLWENWDGSGSQNHIMFGDISAWLYHYLGGIQPDPAHPGFAQVTVQPWFAPSIDWAKAEHHTPHGRLACTWRRSGDNVELDLEIPPGIAADFQPLGSTIEVQPLSPGKHHLTLAASATGPAFQR